MDVLLILVASIMLSTVIGYFGVGLELTTKSLKCNSSDDE